MTMNITDLLGAVMQSGMSPSSGNRMKNALGGSGGGGLLENLAGMLGGQSQQGGGLGGILGNVLNDAGNAVGGKQNLALGGLGALAGALLGGGGKSLGGALGGGVMALLGTMAYQALKGAGRQEPEVPLGLLEPQSEAERQALEQNSATVLKAMINAAKADGQIDQREVKRIVGKLQATGMGQEAQQYVMNEMQKPIDTPALVAAVKGQPALAAQVYAASLLAIEVDTPAEKQYLDQLAVGLGLQPEVTQRIKDMVGLRA
jgi:uncharacterized membrane protein YebE (DUF533 family)